VVALVEPTITMLELSRDSFENSQQQPPPPASLMDQLFVVSQQRLQTLPLPGGRAYAPPTTPRSPSMDISVGAGAGNGSGAAPAPAPVSPLNPIPAAMSQSQKIDEMEAPQFSQEEEDRIQTLFRPPPPPPTGDKKTNAPYHSKTASGYQHLSSLIRSGDVKTLRSYLESHTSNSLQWRTLVRVSLQSRSVEQVLPLLLQFADRPSQWYPLTDNDWWNIWIIAGQHSKRIRFLVGNHRFSNRVMAEAIANAPPLSQKSTGGPKSSTIATPPLAWSYLHYDEKKNIWVNIPLSTAFTTESMDDVTDPYHASGHFNEYDFTTQTTTPPVNSIHLITFYDSKHDTSRVWYHRML